MITSGLFVIIKSSGNSDPGAHVHPLPRDRSLIVSGCHCQRDGFQHRKFVQTEAPAQIWIFPAKMPKVAPRTPRWTLGICPRSECDLQPVVHSFCNQVVSNFFSSVHSWKSSAEGKTPCFERESWYGSLQRKHLAPASPHFASLYIDFGSR
jgi:hypothetical protein